MGQTSTILYGVNPPKQINLGLTSRSKEIYGLAFPTGKKKGAGDYSKQAGITLLQNNLEQLLLTEKGERIMFPQYGLSLRKYLFEPLTQELFINIKHEIITSINAFFPGVSIQKIVVVESSEVNVEGGMGLDITLYLSAVELNNTIFTVGVIIK